MAFFLPVGAAEIALRRQAMFESATFESLGIIHTRSSRWMGAVMLLDISLLLAMILIPLLYPQALPTFKTIWLMPVPAPERQTPPQPTIRPSTSTTEMPGGVILMPTQIPHNILYIDGPEPQVDNSVVSWISNPAASGGDPFGNHAIATVVRPVLSGPVRISSITAESELLQKTLPVYPPIARAARVEGTVRLAATISKIGTIENLRVTSGHPMLQQAALNAVSCWRYKPYLLDGQPVEVETTVDVIFTLSR
jgi:protein TonB